MGFGASIPRDQPCRGESFFLPESIYGFKALLSTAICFFDKRGSFENALFLFNIFDIESFLTRFLFSKFI